MTHVAETEPEGLALHCSCGEWAMLFRNAFGLNAAHEHKHHAELASLRTQLAEARAQLDRVRNLTADLVRADNNRTGRGPEGRITGADTLPLQTELGMALTLREPFGAVDTYRKDKSK